MYVQPSLVTFDLICHDVQLAIHDTYEWQYIHTWQYFGLLDKFQVVVLDMCFTFYPTILYKLSCIRLLDHLMEVPVIIISAWKATRLLMHSCKFNWLSWDKSALGFKRSSAKPCITSWNSHRITLQNWLLHSLQHLALLVCELVLALSDAKLLVVAPLKSCTGFFVEFFASFALMYVPISCGNLLRIRTSSEFSSISRPFCAGLVHSFTTLIGSAKFSKGFLVVGVPSAWHNAAYCFQKANITILCWMWCVFSKKSSTWQWFCSNTNPAALLSMKWAWT